ncbi:MAG: CDP-glycerol glycerophosphotransferase family protein [Bacteroidales bacterium]|nr:CDP-glycerol glycerophosphotransferase family protein [Bacteroidales bacterium]
MLKDIIKRLYHFFLKDPFFVIKYNRIQARYPKIVRDVRERVHKNNAIKVGFYVVYDASWGARPLFEAMQHDSTFEPKIVVCPDTARGNKNRDEKLKQTYENLVNLYGVEYVFNSYDDSLGFKDLSNDFDIIGLANPYDNMTYEYYGANYLSHKKKLVFFNAYGYQGKLTWEFQMMKLCSHNLVWKLFVDNVNTQIIAKQHQYIHGKNIVVSGSCKMDKLSLVKATGLSDRKKIIIAPHHTVRQGGLNLSNFLRFSELIQILPQKYPKIDFIFRPHPLLFTTLRCDDLWGEQKVDEWLNRLLQNENVTYSIEGEYFDIFKSSDAMIDDCGSFLAEYFYTGKPQCYVLRDDHQFETEYLDWGKKFFNYVYKAFTENDIFDFIDKVVVKGEDSLKEERQAFAKQEVMINYPHVADFVMDYLKKELL